MIIVGSIGWFYSYSKSHLTIEQVKELLEVLKSHHGITLKIHGLSITKSITVTDSMESYEHDSEHANHGHEDSHAEHVLHQIHNRPYAALYVAAFFFMMISLRVY